MLYYAVVILKSNNVAEGTNSKVVVVVIVDCWEAPNWLIIFQHVKIDTHPVFLLIVIIIEDSTLTFMIAWSLL